MREWLATWLVALGACLLAVPCVSSAAGAVIASGALQIQMLDAATGDVSIEELSSGTLDLRFQTFDFSAARQRDHAFWLRLRAEENSTPGSVPTLNISKSRTLQIQAYTLEDGRPVLLRTATFLPGFRGLHQMVLALPHRLAKDQVLYVRVDPQGQRWEGLQFAVSTLEQTLATGAEHARMIALAFGALLAMACSSLLIWLVLSDRLLLLYATLFSLQALYVAYLSGQGFEWPVLQLGAPVMSYTWNVTAALSGAAACLFVREIAELRLYSPKVHAIFRWLAITFVVLAFANVAQEIGLGVVVAAIGNLVFLGSALFTLVVSFLAWQRNNRAAGWFLIAWGLLEGFTIATAVRLLLTDPEGAEGLLYYGLPLSMVAAAVLIALGVADRLRDQRLALSDAEKRAQTDPLTGVLNRRSLVERLEAACLRARARGLPIALLFIDLDHFKEINDTRGHQAGDACLRAVIGPIHAELRQSDVIGRYGGEEFVVILSSADIAAAGPIAERIRNRVADVRVEGFGPPIQVTCSIGVATSDTLGVWGEHLIARADAAVYDAKRSGRNRVQIAGALPA
ncbi:GGDEF domain-containing protein [Steroidobacter cummioxidans]|uniref:GGDEF domain-containing protein n=1 Tax=Steroidobacter cummioxidans TaxID=1803913 RepID=UPI00129004E6|nr:GGDEF domain-containing protein [Steroidobacter cummioxidans]